MIERKRFEPQKLEEDRVSEDIVRCRHNAEERDWLEALKLYHNTTKDATALKNEAYRVFKQMKLLRKIQSDRR